MSGKWFAVSGATTVRELMFLPRCVLDAAIMVGGRTFEVIERDRLGCELGLRVDGHETTINMVASHNAVANAIAEFVRDPYTWDGELHQARGSCEKCKATFTVTARRGPEADHALKVMLSGHSTGDCPKRFADFPTEAASKPE